VKKKIKLALGTFKQFVISLFITLLFFFITDFFITQYLKNSSKSLFEFKTQGYYNLKPNQSNLEVFGSIIYKVDTDKNGFRFNKNKSKKIKYDIVILGDSFIYGMGDYNKSIIGKLSQNSNLNILNAGVPSYSPTTYLFQYKNILKKKLHKKKHTVIAAIDMSDLQDETSRWFDLGDIKKYESYLDKNISNQNYPIVILKNSLKTKDKNIRKSIKEFIISNFKFTIFVYRILKSIFIVEENKYLNVFKTERASFTFQDWNELNNKKFPEGYAPLNIEKGLIKLETKIVEIIKTAKENKAEIFLLIYPWPGQLYYEGKKFSWQNYIQNICEIEHCNGVINLFPVLQKYKIKNDDWYFKLYLPGDIHFNEFGNELVADEILKVIKNY
jgi:hypothetical protein